MSEKQSPFPGVDPYLEDPAFWADFHATLLPIVRELVIDALPDDYDARLDESMRIARAVDIVAGASGTFPDVAITRTDVRPPERRQIESTVATLEPITFKVKPFWDDPETHSWVEVRHRYDRTLVTIVEVVSPTNKRPDERSAYLRRREELLSLGVNFVEIDLLLEGQSIILRSAWPNHQYAAFVTHAVEPETIHAYAWSLPDRLPVIPVPLRDPDPDIALDLAASYHRAYRSGRYWRQLNYTKPPKANIPSEHAEFVARTAGYGLTAT